jgi:hypothetical protein
MKTIMMKMTTTTTRMTRIKEMRKNGWADRLPASHGQFGTLSFFADGADEAGHACVAL